MLISCNITSLATWMLQKFVFLGVICLAYGLVLPPDPKNVPEMARYIIHETDWVGLATISTQKAVKGFPFVGLKSFCDGPVNNSTGVPYLYMTDMDISGKDVLVDNRVTILATLAETNYCSSQKYDPQDPRCAKVIISGRLIKLDKGTPEYNFGKESLYARHPPMKNWPTDHEFYVAKINIKQIEVLDFFGGIKKVSLEDYFKADPSYAIHAYDAFPQVSIIDMQAQ